MEQFKSATRNILLYLKAIGPGAFFRGKDIVLVSYGHSLSALRLLRKLRARGLVDYRVVEQNKSLYQLLNIKEANNDKKQG